MLFNTVEYIIFFAVAVLIYYVLPKKVRYLWLLAASYAFYMNWNAQYGLLLLFSTAVTYAAGLFISRFADKPGLKKAAVAFSFISNIGLLGYFKYTAFLAKSLNALIGAAGGQPFDFVWNVALPVGISFFVFQALGYTVDVYRGRIDAERNFFRYALFVSFFPQLVAGPIERSENLLRQLREVPEKVRPNYRNITNGLIVLLWGLFLKMVIADRVSQLVDTVFGRWYVYGTVELVLAAVAFALQIYCDFAGYSLAAMGSAQVLGFSLMSNFETPYFAQSVREFWRRWHISLSNWFRDYLYIPLGGSRCSKARKRFNLMVTMGISGLWHGAGWNYVLWGLLHGIYQVGEDVLGEPMARLGQRIGMKTESFSHRLLKGLWTFMLVDFAWILFRADSITMAIGYLKRMFTVFNPWVLFDGSLYGLGLDRTECNILFFGLLVLLAVDLIRRCSGLRIDEFLEKQELWFKWLCVLGLLTAVWVWGIYGPEFSSAQFIYFQF